MMSRLILTGLSLAFCSCASVGVRSTQLVSETPPRKVPAAIFVKPFAYYEPNVAVDRSGTKLSDFQYEFQEKFTRFLTSRLSDGIAPASAMAATAPPRRGNYWLVTGQFDRSARAAGFSVLLRLWAGRDQAGDDGGGVGHVRSDPPAISRDPDLRRVQCRSLCLGIPAFRPDLRRPAHRPRGDGGNFRISLPAGRGSLRICRRPAEALGDCSREIRPPGLGASSRAIILHCAGCCAATGAAMILSKDSHVLFYGDSITDCGRNRDDINSLGNGYAFLIAGRLQSAYPVGTSSSPTRASAATGSSISKSVWKRTCSPSSPTSFRS